MILATAEPKPALKLTAADGPPQPLSVPSCSSVLHQRRNLHELDVGAYAVETRYAVQKRIGEKGLGCVL